METSETSEAACPAHGPGTDPSGLVGRRVVRVVASWWEYDGRRDEEPVDVWLIDDQGGSTAITTGSDWCLVVASDGPSKGYDLGEEGRLVVLPVRDETPFAAHLGEPVLGVRQEWDPVTGRVALELDFTSGAVRCDGWGGDLRLAALEGGRAQGLG